MQKKLIEHLSGFITPERLLLFEKVLEQRTAYITVVLEDIFQPQNASAVLRTCDCFGIQHVHIIENRNKFTVDREVALGASKWLSLHKYNEKKQNSLKAIKSLKESGYRIVATTPHKNDQLLPEFDLTKGKTAIVFGSELPGISETIQNEADEFLKIPMSGFTESFNISVSAAIVLYQLSEKIKKQNEIFWQLTEQEKDTIKLQWLRNSIKRSNLLEQRFLKEQGSTGTATKTIR
ncbi:TrmH family RNA methyltransferase [Mariniphaga sediminis]|uniref:tRNA (guanosine(18)-2'-O)-methyltransferase n=1 Tax=Mariniphaga sediminis TaxID=1628158 RepID=A0A399D125_9BACT|nr:RNA methyltransferase [Mariniphaga sediminis]RIH64371.1 TrmH family RNA methyltransferase [Mariniphaga sediminis]